MVVSTTSEVAVSSVEAAAWKRLHVVPMLRMVHVDETWSTSSLKMVPMLRECQDEQGPSSLARTTEGPNEGLTHEVNLFTATIQLGLGGGHT